MERIGRGGFDLQRTVDGEHWRSVNIRMRGEDMLFADVCIKPVWKVRQRQWGGEWNWGKLSAVGVEVASAKTLRAPHRREEEETSVGSGRKERKREDRRLLISSLIEPLLALTKWARLLEAPPATDPVCHWTRS